MNRSARLFWVGIVFCLASFLTGCGSSGVKNDYVLAEQLWQEGRFESSARLFERVFQREPKETLGQQALYRAATTRLLFLRQYSKALELFSKYLEIVPLGPTADEARAQLGDIYFSKLRQYDRAIEYYQHWLEAAPSSPDRSEFLYRIGRSQFLSKRFVEATTTFQKIIREGFSEKRSSAAIYQLGMTYLTQAVETKFDKTEKKLSVKDLHRLATQQFDWIEQKYPHSLEAPEAALGSATSLEERGLWDEALKKLMDVQARYPVPQVVKIRIHRIQERLTRRAPVPKR